MYIIVYTDPIITPFETIREFKYFTSASDLVLPPFISYMHILVQYIYIYIPGKPKTQLFLQQLQKNVCFFFKLW